MRRKSGLTLYQCWLAAALLLTGGPLQLQAADFQIVWIAIGDVTSANAEGSVRAGRHLFMASDVADLSLKNVSVARVEVTPQVSALVVGQRLCLTSLRIVATDGKHLPVKQAPLSVSVRQDQRDVLGVDRRSDDICVRPAATGEYPIRFTSALPAADGTMRGAQIFVRVSTSSDQ
jgi:hypothetical protein